MKKLFNFMSTSGNNNAVPPRATNKQNYGENSFENGINKAHGKTKEIFHSPKSLFSKSRKQISDSHTSSIDAGLRRTRSLSSAAFLVTEPELTNLCDQSRSSQFKDQNRSPSSSIASDLYQFDHSARRRSLTPERQRPYRPAQFDVSSIKNPHGFQKPGSASPYNDSSGNSSTCSSNNSSQVVDRFIVEQQPEKSRSWNNSQGNYSRNGYHDMKLPPKVQFTAPNSPTHSGAKYKSRAHSFREAKGTCLRFSSRDCTENGFGNESPRSLAKNVIERLSQSHAFPSTSSKEFDLDHPITIKDIYDRSLNGCCDSDSEDGAPNSSLLCEPYGMTNDYHGIDTLTFQKRNVLQGGDCEGLSCDEEEEDVDAGLRRRSKEAEERVIHLSEELERRNFIPDCGFDVPALVQTIKNLEKERVSLAIEVSGLLQSQISERTSANKELKCMKAELASQTRRLEKEKNEIQSGLEKELDRRSSEWSLKLEKYRLEEQRLRDRVRELAEHNVSLQREVSSFAERETESKNLISYTEQQMKELTGKIEEVKNEKQDLQRSLLEVHEKYNITEETRDCIQRNYKEKEKECKDLHKSIARLLRTCNEQEKTISGLRDGFSEELQKNQSMERVDKHVAKLQMEQIRLSGVELALRRELESYRVEADSLRHENIILLNRLKGDGKEIVAATFKLEKELWAHVHCLQNQGLTMLNESTDLCSKLLEFIKGKSVYFRHNTQQDMDVIKNGLDGQFVVESDTKIQGFKTGIEGLTRSLQMMSALLHEKSSTLTSNFQSQGVDADKLANPSDQDVVRIELKAECLVTSVLREKLYSKELQVEQLHAELAAAVRGNEILKSEVQNALDNLSCVTHKLKDLELQMLKKDESINQLQSDLQESMKELTIIRGILPQVSDTRDQLWEQVKQYSEQNMLLNSEVNVLKKKIEALDEDVLLKEGQITILKDSLGKKPFDILGSPDSMHEFLLN